MKNLIAVLILLIVPAIANAQDAPALSVETSSIVIEQVEKTVVKTVTRFEGYLLETSERDVSQKTSETNAALVSCNQPATVLAFDNKFESVEVTQVGDGADYLLTGVAGKYLVIVNTGTQSTVRVAEIQSSGPETASLALMSADLARRLDDEPTQTAIASNLIDAEVSSAEDFAAAKLLSQNAIETALSARTGPSKYKDWLNGWRRPIQAEMKRLEIDTLEEYSPAIDSVVQGLMPQPVSESIDSVAIKTAAPVIPIDRYLQPRFELKRTGKQCNSDGTCTPIYQWVPVNQR